MGRTTALRPLYRSKSDAGGAIVEFETAFLHAYEYRQRMEAEFRVALEGGAIELVYQPIVDLRSGQVEAVEALARWSDSSGAEVSPAYFIPLAEECGIIRGVGRTLLDKALLETRPWFDSGRIQRVSCNVSRLEFLDEGFSDAVMAALERVGVARPAVARNHRRRGDPVSRIGRDGDASPPRARRQIRARRLRLRLFEPVDLAQTADLRAQDPPQPADRCRDRQCGPDHPSQRRFPSPRTGNLLDLRGRRNRAQIEFLRRIRCDLVQGFAAGRPGHIDEVEKCLRPPSPETAARRAG